MQRTNRYRSTLGLVPMELFKRNPTNTGKSLIGSDYPQQPYAPILNLQNGNYLGENVLSTICGYDLRSHFAS